MQIPGHGLRLPISRLKAVINERESIRCLFLNFVQAFVVQASHTALANGRAKMNARLARWLIMAHDRLDGNEVPLTHEFLSIMLGVRRPGVTLAIQSFESDGLIDTRRNVLTVRNRTGLEKLADGIYGVPESEQERLTGWRPLHSRNFLRGNSS
jgi:CRP-like cAMP-binding protein